MDTPGAYPGIDAEERGQAEAIARNLREMARLSVPVISVCHRRRRQWRRAGSRRRQSRADVRKRHLQRDFAGKLRCDHLARFTKAELAAAALRLTAEELLKLGLVDTVVAEPSGGAHEDTDGAARLLSEGLARRSAAFPLWVRSNWWISGTPNSATWAISSREKERLAGYSVHRRWWWASSFIPP